MCKQTSASYLFLPSHKKASKTLSLQQDLYCILAVDLLMNCGNIIDLDPDSNGYILVKDSGTKDNDCEMTIQCSKDRLISTRFLVSIM